MKKYGPDRGGQMKFSDATCRKSYGKDGYSSGGNSGSPGRKMEYPKAGGRKSPKMENYGKK